METPIENTAAPSVDVPRIVRHRGDRWFFSYDLHAEEWSGCHKTLEEAVNHALEYRDDYYIPHASPCYFALGIPAPKKECDDMGVEWPWYHVDTSIALRIHLSNELLEAVMSWNVDDPFILTEIEDMRDARDREEALRR
jgi:hypothetical protein